jgi:hypothetical protein
MLFSSDWRSPDDLAVGLDTDDRQLAFAACTGLTRSAGIAGSNSRKRRCSA